MKCYYYQGNKKHGYAMLLWLKKKIGAMIDCEDYEDYVYFPSYIIANNTKGEIFVVVRDASNVVAFKELATEIKWKDIKNDIE